MVGDPKSLDAPTRRDEVEGEGAIRGTARMEAFADAVFAIAFTLPVVHIAMPEIANDGVELAHDLGTLVPAYAGYIIASIVIGLYWVQHHFSGAIYRSTGHWFVIATTAFLAAIGFIAFPARVFAEHFADAAARPAGAQYWVVSLAIVSLAWLLKWSVGVTHGHIDARLERDYGKDLTRRYRIVAMLNVVAAIVVFWHWPLGLALSTALVAWLIIPPETPRYITEAPIIEGEA
ncbi:MAG: TMEM175 family protein [Pseudomonadota bacterium]|nr:TMEM175 family protein [Pseudomonadota bacterium]